MKQLGNVSVLFIVFQYLENKHKVLNLKIFVHETFKIISYHTLYKLANQESQLQKDFSKKCIF